MTGAEVAITMAVISATTATVAGIEQYNTAKAGVKSTRYAEAANNEKLARNIKLTERQRTEALRDEARKRRLETGAIEAQMSGTGLSMDVGSPLELQLYNDIAQDIDVVRLNAKFDDSLFSQHVGRDSANYALGMQRDKLQAEKTGALWGTVAKVGSTGVSAYGAATASTATGATATAGGSMPDFQWH